MSESTSTKTNKDRSDYLMAEYGALRSEIDSRRDMRYKLVSYALVLFGTMVAFTARGGENAALILLIFPVICCLFSLLYAHNLKFTTVCSIYIRERIEPVFLREGWESWIAHAGASGRFRFSNNPSTAAIFITLDLCAIGISVVTHAPNLAVSSLYHWALLLFSALGTIGAALVHWRQHSFGKRVFQKSSIVNQPNDS